MEVRSAICTVPVILLVLVSSGLSAPPLVISVRPASANTSKELTISVDLNQVLTVVKSMTERLMSSKLFEPHQIKSFVFLLKEVIHVMQNFGKLLRELLSNPQKLVSWPYATALALIVMSYIPDFILPSKAIAFVLSFSKILSNYWSPSDVNNLSQLQEMYMSAFI